MLNWLWSKISPTTDRYMTRFMQANYTDERLAWLLAHAESGKLRYNTCCCFIGIATADHQLKSSGVYRHLDEARRLPFAIEAEREFLNLAMNDRGRRYRVIPLVKVEIERRDRVAAKKIGVPAFACQ